MSPAIIDTPARDSALIALKNPPMLHPKDRTEPIPINIPPIRALINSRAGAPLTWNCFDKSAEAIAPTMIPKFKIEVLKRWGSIMIISETSMVLKNQFPQFLTPSETLQAFS